MANTSAFGRTAFNSAPFNTFRPALHEISINSVGDGRSAVIANVSAVIDLEASGSSLTEAMAGFLLDAEISAAGKSKTDIFVIAYSMSASSFVGIDRSDLDASVYLLFTLDGLTLNPGDSIEINTCDYTVKLNGTIIYSGYSGKFFNIQPGKAEIVYEDTAGNRNVEMLMQYTEKYL